MPTTTAQALADHCLRHGKAQSKHWNAKGSVPNLALGQCLILSGHGHDHDHDRNENGLKNEFLAIRIFLLKKSRISASQETIALHHAFQYAF